MTPTNQKIAPYLAFHLGLGGILCFSSVFYSSLITRRQHCNIRKYEQKENDIENIRYQKKNCYSLPESDARADQRLF